MAWPDGEAGTQRNGWFAPSLMGTAFEYRILVCATLWARSWSRFLHVELDKAMKER